MILRRTVLAALLGLAPTVASAGERWPTWPSEVERVAAPTRPTDRPSHDAERAASLIRLEVYATAVIETFVVDSLSDPSSHVRREALRICYLRRIDACVAPATAIYGDKVEPTLKAAALRVIALDPKGKRLGILLGALRDSSEPLRAQAAQLVGAAPLVAADRDEARRALLAKLSDTASSVRAHAVESVGLLGPGDGTLAVTGLLEDPEPIVRAAAAEALGRMRDEAAVPGLIRAIEGPNEAIVLRALIDALARLPGDKAAEELLRVLDTPPLGVGSIQVAEAIGDRPDPEPALLQGLIDRLDEPSHQFAVERSLLLLGRAAVPALRRAQSQGLEPGLSSRVHRLIAAASPAAQAPPGPSTALAADARVAWTERLTRGEMSTRLDSAAELGAMAPPWLWGRLAQKNFSTVAPEQLRPWMVAMAVSDGAPWDRATTGAELWARLTGLAHDRAQADADRCLAVLALGAARTTPAARTIAREVVSLLRSDKARVRACAVTTAVALGRPALAFEGLLDTDDRVRTASTFALGQRLDASSKLPPDVVSRIAVLAATDASPEVRAAATWAMTQRESERPAMVVMVTTDAPDAPWGEPSRFLEAALPDGTKLWLPALTSGGVRWSLVPGIEGATATPPATPPL